MVRMSHSWMRYDHAEEGADRILDAAGAGFAAKGVDGTTMIDVARLAGCSRATLYRYFTTRADLQLAYVNRAALRIAADIRGGTRRSEPAAELTRRIQLGLAGVRSDPLLAVWFEPRNLAVPVALSGDSEVLAALAIGFFAELGVVPGDHDDLTRRGGWLLRSIVSMLAMPADAATEADAISRFIVPALLAELPLSQERTR